jgi:YtkA-like
MARQLTRRGCLRLIGGVTLSALATACQSAAGSGSSPTFTPSVGGSTSKSTDASDLKLVLANSELAVGQNRFAMAVLEGSRPVVDAAVRLEFFEVDGQSATKRSEAEAIYRAADQSGKGLYVARVAFDRPGAWGIQVAIARPGSPAATGRAGFEVLPQTVAPMPGTRAIASRNPTAREVANIADICSAQPPCNLHELSVAEALTETKPTMVVFATPGYCTTQTCAPVLGEAQKVSTRRAGQANFVHVEIYKDPRNLVVADAVTEWSLKSEPWVFVVDRDGFIADRIESITNAEELEASLAPLL